MQKLAYNDFKAARAAFPVPGFALQTTRESFTYRGTYYRGPHDGAGGAAYVAAKARAALAGEEAAEAAAEAARAALRDLWEARAAERAAADKARKAAAWRYGPGTEEEGPAAFLRYIGRVVPDSGPYDSTWDTRGDCGWHTDPHGLTFRDGSGLCFGVVYQLTGKDGAARFVAGFQFGGVDGGPTLDLSRVYSVTGEESGEDGGRHSGAAAADSMAKAAAEEDAEEAGAAT